MNSDRTLRAELKRTLLHPSKWPAGTRVVDELNAFNSRIDLAVVAPGALHGYEIKSDNDTLSRLRDQAMNYSYVFDTLTLVTTMRHHDKAQAMLPDYWGMVVAIPERPKSEDFRFLTLRQAGTNPQRNIVHALGLLWRDERRAWLIERGLKRSGTEQQQLRRMIEAEPDKARLMAFLCATLQARPAWRDDEGRSLIVAQYKES